MRSVRVEREDLGARLRRAGLTLAESLALGARAAEALGEAHGRALRVGGREVGFMAGMYKKLANRADCVFTGKGLSFGGSLIRPEATGYGTVYFAEEMLKQQGRSFEGLRVSVSGAGNVKK